MRTTIVAQLAPGDNLRGSLAWPNPDGTVTVWPPEPNYPEHSPYETLEDRRA